MPSRFPSTTAPSEAMITSRSPSPSASVGWILVPAGAGSVGVVLTRAVVGCEGPGSDVLREAGAALVSESETAVGVEPLLLPSET